MFGGAVQHVVLSPPARDLWDWLIVTGALAGGVGALATAVSVGYGALQFRQRPETQIEWAFERDDAPWPHDLVVTVRSGTEFSVRVAARNVGSAVGEATMINMIVPDCFKISAERDTRVDVGQPSGNPIAGRYTRGRVNFLHDERRFFPNLTWMQRFTITPDPRRTMSDVEFEIVFVLEDPRLNTHGFKWLWSRALPLQEHLVTTREWRRVEALPKGQIACGPGYRRSTRRVRVLPAE